MRERDAINETIMEHGWDPRLKVSMQYCGSGVLDVANLLMALVFFVSPTDPRMLSTIDAVLSDLARVKHAAANWLGEQEGRQV